MEPVQKSTNLSYTMVTFTVIKDHFSNLRILLYVLWLFCIKLRLNAIYFFIHIVFD